MPHYRKLRKVLRVVVCLAFAPLLCTAQGKPADACANHLEGPSRVAIDPQQLATIPPRLEEFVKQGNLAGAVFLVARKGKVASLVAVGYQDLETKKPMRPDTIFQIRSMSKSVTAVAVLILVEKRRLRLDDPVEKHLPELRGIGVLEARAGEQPGVRGAVRPPTVRDLLTHTSGIPDEIPAEIRAPFPRPKSLAELVPIIANAPLLFDPGTDYKYSGMGYAVLGRLVEVASGQPFEQFVRRRIFSPLAMKDSFFVPPPDKKDRIASSYEIKDGRLEKAGYYDISQMAWLTFPKPSWSMFSTACDLFAFYQMVLNGGSFGGKRILSRKTVELMTSVQAEHTKTRLSGTAYGFGWFVSREPQRALWPQTAGSYGHCGLLNTCAWVDPEWELIRVFLMQRVPEGPEVVLVNEERDLFMRTSQAAIIMAPN